MAGKIDLIRVIKGLKQGRISPILFSLYFDCMYAYILKSFTDELADNISKYSINLLLLQIWCLLFADDVVLTIQNLAGL